MSNIDKRALREAAEKATKGPWKAFSDTGTATYAVHTPSDKRCENIIKWAGFDCQPNAGANAEFIAAFNPQVALALLDELEATERRNTKLTDVLRQTVSGYKSCLRTGHERILDLGGSCDAPEVMIAGNPEIRQAEQLLAAAGKGD